MKIDRKDKYLKNIACMVDYKRGHGEYLPVRFIGWAIICFIFGMLFTALIILVSVFDDPLWALSLLLFLPLFFGGATAIMVNRKKKLSEIFLFLDDAKEYTAQAVTEESQREIAFGSFIPINQRKTIRIEFNFNGEIISKIATGMQSLYTQYVGRYTDREIRILYSPKYDFILIVKDNG